MSMDTSRVDNYTGIGMRPVNESSPIAFIASRSFHDQGYELLHYRVLGLEAIDVLLPFPGNFEAKIFVYGESDDHFESRHPDTFFIRVDILMMLFCSVCRSFFQ